VAIKVLQKDVVRRYLAEGGREDPFKEVARMHALGDGTHVLESFEALEDEVFLFSVMPYSEEGSLKDKLEAEL
jgi:hypothetical protein